MLNEIKIVKPNEIEKRSMEIITQELNGRTWPEPQFSIVKRCIHTSADFDYADNLCFSENAAMLGVEALRRGAVIVTDTKMAWSGINKKKLAEYGGEAYCFMSDEDVAKEAQERGCTRAAICMERGAALGKEVIFAVGNAPTALIRLYELIQEGKVNPALIIGSQTGNPVVAAAKGIVESIDINEETGTTLTMNIGDNYELIYGQLKEVAVAQGDVVEQGELLGYVSEPTKYYCEEGSNLYFAMKKDGQVTDPCLYLE